MLQSKLIKAAIPRQGRALLAGPLGFSRGVADPLLPQPRGARSISERRDEQVAVRGDQLRCVIGAKELLILLFPGQLPPPGPRRLQSSPDRQEFVAMCWESRFPPAVGSRTGVRGRGGPAAGRGPAPAPSIPPRAGVMLPGLCPGRRMGAGSSPDTRVWGAAPQGMAGLGGVLRVIRFSFLLLARAVGWSFPQPQGPHPVPLRHPESQGLHPELMGHLQTPEASS